MVIKIDLKKPNKFLSKEPIDVRGDFLVDLGQYMILVNSRKESVHDLTFDDFNLMARQVLAAYKKKEWWSEFRTVFPNGLYNPGVKPGTKYQVKDEKTLGRKLGERGIEFAQSRAKEMIDAGKEKYDIEIEHVILESCTTYIKNPPTDAEFQCVYCGSPTNFIFAKKDFPFYGTKTYANFMPNLTGGLPVCGRCYFYMFISPLAYHGIGKGWFLTIQTNNSAIMKQWVVEKLHETLSGRPDVTIYRKSFDLKTKDGAIFFDVFTILDHLEMEKERIAEFKNTSLYFFLWSNGNQNATLERILFPRNVFNFILSLKIEDLMNQFYEIIHAGFIIQKSPKKAEPAGSTAKPAKRKGKKTEDTVDMPVIEGADFSTIYEHTGNAEQTRWKENFNIVLRRLLEGKSILGFFIDKENGHVRSSWPVLKCYLIEVMRMSETKIDLIKKVGLAISQLMNSVDRDKYKRDLFWDIERCDKVKYLVSYFAMADRIALEQGIEMPVKFTDVVSVLFPSMDLGDFPKDWELVRDLIRFLIYENSKEIVKNYLSKDRTTTTGDA